jgi:hypothetical protein
VTEVTCVPAAANACGVGNGLPTISTTHLSIVIAALLQRWCFTLRHCATLFAGGIGNGALTIATICATCCFSLLLLLLLLVHVELATAR